MPTHILHIAPPYAPNFSLYNLENQKQALYAVYKTRDKEFTTTDTKVSVWRGKCPLRPFYATTAELQMMWKIKKMIKKILLSHLRAELSEVGGYPHNIVTSWLSLHLW